MFLGCAESGDASSADDYMDFIQGFKNKIAATGITWLSNCYWSSTPSGSFAWFVYVLLYGSDALWYFYEGDTFDSYRVLGCLVF